MKVDAGANYLFVGQRNHSSARAGAPDFASMLAPRTAETREATGGAAKGTTPDFAKATRQELFDWMNSQISSGDMTFDESSAFLSMTVKIDAVTGQAVDMATDATQVDFTQRARQGIEFYLSRFDYASAQRLQDALHTMQRSQ